MPKALTVETRTGLSISALRLKTRRVCVCVCVCVSVLSIPGRIELSSIGKQSPVFLFE